MVAIEEYNIIVLIHDGVTFEPVPTADCDGSDSDVINNKLCYVDMASLRGYPYFLQQAEEVIIKVQARNSVGWSLYSSVNTANKALMQDVPHKPLGSPTRDDILTSDILL